jgi:protein SCO1/2
MAHAPMTTTDTDPPTAEASSSRPRRWHRLVALLVGVPLLVAVLAWGALQVLQPHRYAGTVMQAPTEAPPMDDLIDDAGQPIDLTAYRGDLVVVFFGYTHCPDVCPTTLANVDRALDEMGSDAARVHLLMVSVDPARDTPQQMADYLGAFDPTFRGATGDLDAVERVAATYGVFFARGEDLDGGGYAVDHTASLMAIDTEGHLRIVWPTDVRADALASDLRELL